jgi:hypothetical protein
VLDASILWHAMQRAKTALPFTGSPPAPAASDTVAQSPAAVAATTLNNRVVIVSVDPFA